MEEKKKKIIYVLEEDAYLKYLLQVESDKKAVSRLLFKGNNVDKVSMLSKSLLCEYFGALRHFENVLDEMIFDNLFDEVTKSYAIPEKQALLFTVYLQSLVDIKEELLLENCSLAFH